MVSYILTNIPLQMENFMSSHSNKTALPNPIHCEDYRGHRIGTAMKSVDKKNPISGHNWSEKEPLKTFDVSVIDQCDTPTRPAIGWSNQQFRSVDAAKKEVDSQIRLSEMIAVIRFKESPADDGTHYEKVWNQYAANLEANLHNGAAAAVSDTVSVPKKLRMK